MQIATATTTEDIDANSSLLSEDKKFLLKLEKGYDTKTKEWEEVKKNRTEELIALRKTIKSLCAAPVQCQKRCQ